MDKSNDIVFDKISGSCNWKSCKICIFSTDECHVLIMFFSLSILSRAVKTWGRKNLRKFKHLLEANNSPKNVPTQMNGKPIFPGSHYWNSWNFLLQSFQHPKNSKVCPHRHFKPRRISSQVAAAHPDLFVPSAQIRLRTCGKSYTFNLQFWIQPKKGETSSVKMRTNNGELFHRERIFFMGHVVGVYFSRGFSLFIIVSVSVPMSR